jgi:hypothetical protein
MKHARRRYGLQKNDLISGILSLFRGKKEAAFARFQDALGNFEISYPEGWTFDRDIAVVDGKYTVPFQSRDGKSRFVVSVDASVTKSASLPEYVKRELEGPCSGIATSMERTRFRGCPAYEREYVFLCDGGRNSAGGLAFSTGTIIFSFTWSAPESEKNMKRAIEKMLDSFQYKKPQRRGAA